MLSLYSCISLSSQAWHEAPDEGESGPLSLNIHSGCSFRNGCPLATFVLLFVPYVIILFSNTEKLVRFCVCLFVFKYESWFFISIFLFGHIRSYLCQCKLCCGMQDLFTEAHKYLSLWCAGSVAALGRLSCYAALGILVLWPRIEPASPALEDRHLTTGPPGKSPNSLDLCLFYLKSEI